MNIKDSVKRFIELSNAFDVETALTLFADDAVIDDVSVGEKFKNTKGVRRYLEQFFVGYKTVTKLKSIEILDDRKAKTQVDFTGSFGQETGGLIFIFNSDGRIERVSAYLD